MNKAECRTLTRKAIAKGELTVDPHCEKCGKTVKLVVHHHDYSNPLDVSRLCTRCHGIYHSMMSLASNRAKGSRKVFNNWIYAGKGLELNVQAMIDNYYGTQSRREL